MGSWISKAANVFRKEGPAPPPQFELACECGQSHSGIRRSRHQHIVCKSCGASLFVLPKDAYPAGSPERSRPAVSKPEASSDYDLDAPQSDSPPAQPRDKSARPIAAEAIFEESGESIPVVRPPKRPPPPPLPVPEQIVIPTSKEKSKSGPSVKTRRRKRDRDAEEELAAAQKEPGLASRLVASVRAKVAGGARWIRSALYAAGVGFIRFWTPLRLTLLAITVMVAGAIAFSVRQSMREQAGRTIREKTEAIAKAMEDKEWLAARRELEPVVAALERLGREDSEANTLRQQLRETTAMSQLSGVSLYEFLQAADDIVASDGTQAWQDKFRTLHAGRWFVIEGPVEQITERVDGRISRGFALSVPWLVGKQQRPVLMRVDLDQFRTLRVGEEPKSAIFAAPLKSCQLDADDEWRVELDGEQGFLWVDPVTYQALGFTFDSLRSEEQVVGLLKDQARFMGISP